MSDSSEINGTDYGPLAGLVGVWTGDSGIDVAPEPDEDETNPYHETWTFTAEGDLDNAAEQIITMLHYTQIVQRKSNDEVFHHQTGYFSWDVANQTVIHSFAIPRPVTVMAGGTARKEGGKTIFELHSELGHADWGITQSPYMRDKASTTAFDQIITLDGDSMHYHQTTTVDIYGRTVAHTDENTLKRQ